MHIYMYVQFIFSYVHVYAHIYERMYLHNAYIYIYIYIACVYVHVYNIYIWYICVYGRVILSRRDYHNLFLQSLLSERGVLGPQLPLWQLMVVCHLWFWVSAFFASGHWGLQGKLGVNKDMENPLPSGKCLHNYGKSPFLMGKSTINGHVQ